MLKRKILQGSAPNYKRFYYMFSREGNQCGLSPLASLICKASFSKAPTHIIIKNTPRKSTLCNDEKQSTTHDVKNDKTITQNDKSTTYKDKSTSYDYKSTAYNNESTTFNDKCIVYNIETAAYGVVFTSCLCENPNERGTSCLLYTSPSPRDA